MNIRLKLLLCLIHICIIMSAQELCDTVKQVTLQEITVKADKIIHKKGYEIVLLSNENRTFGTNALDAISSLPLFQTNLNASSLTSIDRKDVLILINGVVSDGYELKAYSSDEIKNVKYYSVAPAEYREISEGPVIDVIVKKKKEKLYTGYIDLANAVNTGFGTNQVNFAYADSLNRFQIGYLCDYRNIKDINTNSEYLYSPQQYSQYDGIMHYSGSYNRANISYQRFQGKHLFNTKVYFTFTPGKELENRYSNSQTDGSFHSDNSFRLLKSNSNSIAADIYYKYNFNKNNSLLFNIVNTFGSSYSISKQNNNTDVFSSRTDNDTYSLIAHTAYQIRSNNSLQFTINSRYQYKTLTQRYLNIKERPYSHNEFINGRMQYFWRDYSVFSDIGIKYTKQSGANNSVSSFAPSVNLYADWFPQNALKGFNIQFAGQFQRIIPQLSDITDGWSYMDQYMISKGNPDLKNSWRTNLKLTFTYIKNDGNFVVLFYDMPTMESNQYVSTIVRNNEYVYLVPQNIGQTFYNNALLRVVLKPLKWLEIDTYFENYYSKLDTPSQKIRFVYWRAGGSLIFNLKRLTTIININSPTKSYDGDLLTRGSLQYSGIIQYKINKFTLGVKYSYSGHKNYIQSKCSDFSYYNEKEWKSLNHLFQVTATYSFSVGKSRKHEEQILNNYNEETGLNKFNTAKMEP